MPSESSPSVSASQADFERAAAADAVRAYATALEPVRGPRRRLGWLAVVLAAAGWYYAWSLLVVTIGRPPPELIAFTCGGDGAACVDVLRSPQAYVEIFAAPVPRLPVSALGLGYFAFVGFWYLFIGAPRRAGRGWHLLLLAVVLVGAWWSFSYIRIMQTQLHRYCMGCLITHALNGVLLLITLAVWPWRRSSAATNSPAGSLSASLSDSRPASLSDSLPAAPHRIPAIPHPTARLALATATAGSLALLTTITLAYALLFSNAAQQVSDTYKALVDDPDFARWDLQRQPAADIPLYPDELFAGDPAAPNTVVVFGDFQCPHCRDLHGVMRQVASEFPDRLRVAFRYYPQDPECNPNPNFKAAGHWSACRAARAAEAARLIGGRDKYLAMRNLLWERQDQLPQRPYAEQTEAERQRLADWAAELGLDRTRFTAAMDLPAVSERIQADIALGERLAQQEKRPAEIPVVYINGKRLRGWNVIETWRAVLGAPPTGSAPANTTTPASAPTPP